MLPPQKFDAHVFRCFLNSDRYRLRFQNFKVVFDLYLVMLGNYTFLGLAIWQGTKSVYYITFHSADRMTWDENGSYYLGDLHLLNQALFSKQF